MGSRIEIKHLPTLQAVSGQKNVPSYSEEPVPDLKPLRMVPPFFFILLSQFILTGSSYDGPFKGSLQTFEFPTGKTNRIPTACSHFPLRILQASHLKSSLAALVDTGFRMFSDKMLCILSRLPQRDFWISQRHAYLNWDFKQYVFFL